ncbi:MAG: hypothetical protein RSB32_07455 [Mucinivorans sp.]
MAVKTINGQEYGWGDIIIFMWGQPVLRARAIEYKTSQQIEPLRGAGRDPLANQCGERSYTGSITVLQSELEAFNRTARSKGYKSIVGISADIVVQYMKDFIVEVDKIDGATFEESAKGMKTGDLHGEHTIPFKALGIQEGLAG